MENCKGCGYPLIQGNFEANFRQVTVPFYNKGVETPGGMCISCKLFHVSDKHMEQLNINGLDWKCTSAILSERAIMP
jgi:hypothetical protein